MPWVALTPFQSPRARVYAVSVNGRRFAVHAGVNRLAVKLRSVRTLTVALTERLSRRAAGDWAAALTDARVPAGVVNDVAGAFALAREIGLHPTIEVDDPATDGSVTLTRNPIGLTRTPPSYRSAPPPLPG